MKLLGAMEALIGIEALTDRGMENKDWRYTTPPLETISWMELYVATLAGVLIIAVMMIELLMLI